MTPTVVGDQTSVAYVDDTSFILEVATSKLLVTSIETCIETRCPRVFGDRFADELEAGQECRGSAGKTL